MFVSPSGDVFIRSIDTIKKYNDAHKICNALVEYIETVGVNDIVQICIDNASNMKSVPNLLLHCFPSLYFQEFWDTCAIFVHMVELVLISLRTFDGK
jgi:hypothetical protein